jgi:predicted ArsR family transcriptional regulator
MLSDLKHYLRERPAATLADIALHLDVSPDVARAMLERWERKGQVQRLDSGNACGGCDLCQPGGRELYRWVDSADARCRH